MLQFSLRTKLILVCATALFGSAAVFAGIARTVLLRYFDRVEGIHLEAQARRVLHEFTSHMERRMMVARDWSNWTELYNEARDGNVDHFFKENVGASTARNLNLDLLLALSTDGRVLKAYGFDLARATETDPDADVMALFAPGASRLPSNVSTCTCGVLGIPGGAVVFAACPIVTSLGEGPPAGVLVTVHRIDESMIRELSATMQASLTFRLHGDKDLPADMARAARTLTAAAPVITGAIDEDRAAGYALLSDPERNPVMMVRVDEYRTFHAFGEGAFQTILFITSLVALATIILLAIALGIAVLRPIQRLTGHVRGIANTGALKPFRRAQSNDEIGLLAGEFNAMIARLAEAQEKIAAQSREIGESEMRYRSLVELAPMAIAVQVEGKIRFANSSMLVLLGLFDNPQIIGRSIIEFMDEATRGECAAAIEEIERRGGRLNGVKCNFRRADGSIVNADAACACVLYNGEIGVQLAIQDVTERARLEIELRDLSTRDALTGLANRRLFDETVRRECRRASRGGAPIALIMIDIDYFKKYNDNYGHLGGDDVIQRVAGALASNVHRAGDLLARYGGEEFVVILTETGPEGAMILGERLRAAVEALQIPHAYSAAAPHVTISVGIATSFAETRPNAETLIARADQALYASKAAGRNQVTLAEGESRTTPSGA